MATYAFTLAGRATVSVTVGITRGVETASAWGLVLDENADVLGETDSTRYSGFCDWEIAYNEIHRVLDGRWGIESADISAAVDTVIPPCECD